MKIQWWYWYCIGNDTWCIDYTNRYQVCCVLLGIAWYCLVLLGIAWYCLGLFAFGIVWYCLVLLGIAWYCLVIAWYCETIVRYHQVLPGTSRYNLVSSSIAKYCHLCQVLPGIIWNCKEVPQLKKENHGSNCFLNKLSSHV